MASTIIRPKVNIDVVLLTGLITISLVMVTSDRSYEAKQQIQHCHFQAAEIRVST